LDQLPPSNLSDPSFLSSSVSSSAPPQIVALAAALLPLASTIAGVTPLQPGVPTKVEIAATALGAATAVYQPTVDDPDDGPVAALRRIDFPFRYQGTLYSREPATAGPPPPPGTLEYYDYADKAKRYHAAPTPKDISFRDSIPSFSPTKTWGNWPTVALHKRKHFFEGIFHIGTPPQPVRLVVDTGNPKTWVLDALTKVTNPKADVPVYTPLLSASAIANLRPMLRDDDLRAPHFTTPFNGYLGGDTFYIGGIQHPKLDFFIADVAQANTIPNAFEHSGVLGLGVKKVPGISRAGAPAFGPLPPMPALPLPQYNTYWQRLDLAQRAIQFHVFILGSVSADDCGCAKAMVGDGGTRCDFSFTAPDVAVGGISIMDPLSGWQSPADLAACSLAVIKATPMAAIASITVLPPLYMQLPVPNPFPPKGPTPKIKQCWCKNEQRARAKPAVTMLTFMPKWFFEPVYLPPLLRRRRLLRLMAEVNATAAEELHEEERLSDVAFVEEQIATSIHHWAREQLEQGLKKFDQHKQRHEAATASGADALPSDVSLSDLHSSPSHPLSLESLLSSAAGGKLLQELGITTQDQLQRLTKEQMDAVLEYAEARRNEIQVARQHKEEQMEVDELNDQQPQLVESRSKARLATKVASKVHSVQQSQSQSQSQADSTSTRAKRRRGGGRSSKSSRRRSTSSSRRKRHKGKTKPKRKSNKSKKGKNKGKGKKKGKKKSKSKGKGKGKGRGKGKGKGKAEEPVEDPTKAALPPDLQPPEYAHPEQDLSNARTAPSLEPVGSFQDPRTISSVSGPEPVGAAYIPTLMEMDQLAAFYFSGDHGCFSPGFADPHFYKGPITWINAKHSPTSWTIGVTDILINGESTGLCAGGCKGALHTGASQIRGPDTIIMPLMQALPVDPNCVPAPERVLTIVLENGMKVDLGADAQTMRTADGKPRKAVKSEMYNYQPDPLNGGHITDQCMSVLSPFTMPTDYNDPTLLILGTPFLSQVYSIFDFAKSRIGLAQPRHEWFVVNGCKWHGTIIQPPGMEETDEDRYPWCRSPKPCGGSGGESSLSRSGGWPGYGRNGKGQLPESQAKLPPTWEVKAGKLHPIAQGLKEVEAKVKSMATKKTEAAATEEEEAK